MTKAEKLAQNVAKAREIALKGIQSKFKETERIVFDKRRKIEIRGSFGEHTAREIRKNGEVHCWNIPNSVTVMNLENISTEGIISILAELERINNFEVVKPLKS